MRVTSALLLALSACTSIQMPPPLDGAWRVAALNGEAVAGTASFAPGLFVIGFGCNTMRGGYRIEGDRLIPLGGLGRTEMACAPVGEGPDIMAREERGFAIASRPMRIVWEDVRHVRLSNEAGSIDLRR